MDLNRKKKLLVYLSLAEAGLAGLGYMGYTYDLSVPALGSISPAAAGFGAALFFLLLAAAVAFYEFRQHRRTARELHELKERFHLFTEGLKDTALMMLDAGGSIRHWSSAAERLLGFVESDIVGRH